MTIPEIIIAITRPGSHVPEAALAAAAEQREGITAELLRAVESLMENPQRYLDDDDNCLPTIAIYLLAQFREPRAWPLLQRVFRLPEATLEVFGDALGEDGQRWLASVCGGDVAGLMELVADEAISDWPRVAAVNALGVLQVWGELSRPQLLDLYRSLFEERFARPGNSLVWSFLVCACADLELVELLPEIRAAFARGLIDETITTLEGTERELRSPDGQLARFRERHTALTDTALEIGWWSCFQPDDRPREIGDGTAPRADEFDPPPADFSLSPATSVTPAVPFVDDEPPLPQPYRAGVKIGRNDPCPCGSGRKFKKCCGANL
jgi:hypothetical protein